jgi:hypothetical protein
VSLLGEDIRLGFHTWAGIMEGCIIRSHLGCITCIMSDFIYCRFFIQGSFRRIYVLLCWMTELKHASGTAGKYVEKQIECQQNLWWKFNNDVKLIFGCIFSCEASFIFCNLTDGLTDSLVES